MTIEFDIDMVQRVSINCTLIQISQSGIDNKIRLEFLGINDIGPIELTPRMLATLKIKE